MRCMRDARAGGYDLIIAYLPLYSPWHPRYVVRSLINDSRHPWSALTRAFGVSWLRWVRSPVPLVAVDFNDHFGIRRPGFFLLDKADVVFKRELPPDRWQALAGSAHPALPTLRIRSDRRWQERLAKIRPIAVPAPRVDTTSLWDGEFPEKTADIFFSGDTAVNSWVRRTGIAALKELSARGIRVDIPETRLPRQEFYRRMSRAWLAWSPAGFSWECYRTDEAAQCLTVPLVNHPTVERHRPLLHGQPSDSVRHRRRRIVARGRGGARRQGAAETDGACGARARQGASHAAGARRSHHRDRAIVSQIVALTIVIDAAARRGRSPA